MTVTKNMCLLGRTNARSRRLKLMRRWRDVFTFDDSMKCGWAVNGASAQLPGVRAHGTFRRDCAMRIGRHAVTMSDTVR